ncbi:hypothetical protein [Lysobacter hankyongensis]|uniref:GAF domain-containing protein n=1 Tax=Lysobacter hankyongensis TaxID=1176535 RepID=A0ABP9BZX2_9GAMM
MQLILREVAPGDISALECRYALISASATSQDQYLLVAFEGEYRSGSEGAPDAYFMAGAIDNACALWGHAARNGLVIDLRRLRYSWGDDIEGVLRNPYQGACAVVIGPNCSEALGSLWFGFGADARATDMEGIFEDLTTAISYLDALRNQQRQSR